MRNVEGPPSWLVSMRRYVQDALRGRRLATEIDEELQAHVDALVDELIARRLTPDEARREAWRRFGPLERARDEARHAMGVGLIDGLRHDVRSGVRRLLLEPGFAAAVIAVFAVGIGMNAAMFSLLDAAVLKPLPFPRSEQLFDIAEVQRKGTAEETYYLGMPRTRLEDWRAQTQVFDAIEPYKGPRPLTLADGQSTVRAARVGPGLFPLLGLAPRIGRGFLPQDADRGGVVVIGDGLWRRTFGEDPQVLGRELRLKDRSATVIGVMPRGLAFPFADPAVEAWFPLGTTPEPGDSPIVHVVARLRPGLTPASAQPLLDGAAREIQKARPARVSWGASLLPIDPRRWSGADHSMVFVAFGAVGFVLLAACANVANLLLARASNRQREFAIRRALGAGRIRLARQLLVESGLLAGLGGATAALAAFWLVPLIRAVVPPGLIGFPVHEMQIDWRVLVFAFVVSGVVALTSGVLPAIRGAGRGAPRLLTTTGRGMNRTREHRRTRDAFIAVQVTFAMVLLMASGLLVTSYARVTGSDPGYELRDLLVVSMTLPQRGYEDLARRHALYDEALDAVREMPGMRAAASGRPPAIEGAGNLVAEGEEQNPESGGPAAILWAGPDYFRVLGIRLVAGRQFSSADREGTLPVCLVDERAARRFWPGQSPLGKRVRYSPLVPWITVVGVAGNVKTSGVGRAVDQLAIYLPQSQDEQLWATTLLFRSSRDAKEAIAGVRARILTLEPKAQIPYAGPVDELYAQQWVNPRFGALVISTFAALALFTAAVGLYAMLRYAVAQRVTEIGVRLALGARPESLTRLVVADALRPVGIGIATGLGIGAWLTRFIEGYLYRVSRHDPQTMVLVTVLFAAVAAAAAYGPARRATQVDPVSALRAE